MTRVEYKCVPKDKGEGRAEYSRVERNRFVSGGTDLGSMSWSREEKAWTLLRLSS